MAHETLIHVIKCILLKTCDNNYYKQPIKCITKIVKRSVLSILLARYLPMCKRSLSGNRCTILRSLQRSSSSECNVEYFTDVALLSGNAVLECMISKDFVYVY